MDRGRFANFCRGRQCNFLASNMSEFENYLRCGLLEHGFLRGRCDTCHHENLVASGVNIAGLALFLFAGTCGQRASGFIM